MKEDRDLLLILANRVIGPAFLVVGLLVALYMLESEALPIVKKAMDAGVTPEFGLVALEVLLPMAVAFLGLQMIKVKKLWRSDPDK